MNAFKVFRLTHRLINSFIKFPFSTKRIMDPEIKPEVKDIQPPQPIVVEGQQPTVDENKEKKPKSKKQKPEKPAKVEKPQEKLFEPIYVDFQTATFGDYQMINSSYKTERVWTKIINVNETLADKQVLVRARVHNITGKGNNCFIVLRQQFSTLQACIFKDEAAGITKDMIKYISATPCESIVDITGKIVVPKEPIKKCTQQVELQITKFFVVNRSVPQLPIQLLDASRKVIGNQFDQQQKQKEGQQKEATVSMKNRLDNRIIDLRTPAKQAIFRLSSGVCGLFREYLDSNDFIEIHTPKLIGGSSQGGANVFKLKYFNQDACLAQSPQLYKQMCVMADFDRVYEIGPVFRAENAFTHRHMCEFTGLDLQMTIKQNYTELLDFLGELMCYIFKGLQTKFSKQLAAINEQFEFEPFKVAYPPLKLTYAEGIKLLNDNGIEWSVNQDLSTVVEKQLGQLVKQKYDTDFYILHRYPKSARPFYTMLCSDDPNFTCSYDFFMRGEQIISGAQRIHDPVILQQRAKQCGIQPDTIRDYISSFKFGAFPHGGCGVGLQRVVMLYCALKNIRNTSLFPRDPRRITP